MKISFSKEIAVTTAMLMLLPLNAVASITGFVGAAPVIKDPTVYINGCGFVEMTWKSGKSENYSSNAYVKLSGLEVVTITPCRGWHIAAVEIDGSPLVDFDEDGFSVIDVQAKSMISVTFMENGGVDDVETGGFVGAFPDPDVGLFFDHVLTSGFVSAYIIGLEQLGQIGDSWDIKTTADFDPNIIVYLVCSRSDVPDNVDPYDLMLWRTEVVLGDVNLDGKVDGTDESIIANANPSYPATDPRLDLNGDGNVTDEDVVLCANNIGLESLWEPLESRGVIIVNDLVYVYGVTDHLSIFGIHRA